jgi:hypothetical protein
MGMPPAMPALMFGDENALEPIFAPGSSRTAHPHHGDALRQLCGAVPAPRLWPRATAGMIAAKKNQGEVILDPVVDRLLLLGEAHENKL